VLQEGSTSNIISLGNSSGGAPVEFIKLENLYIGLDDAAERDAAAGNPNDGLKFDDTAGDIIIDNCEIAYNYANGILTSDADDITIRNCHIHHNGLTGNSQHHGIYIGGNFPESGSGSGSKRNIIENNLIENNTAYQIQLSDSDPDGAGSVSDNIIRNNMIRNGVIRGGCTINGSDNQYYNNIITTPANGYPGIRVLRGTGNEIYNNTIYDVNDWGIEVVSGNTIRNNICYLTDGITGGTQSNNVLTNPSFASATPVDDVDFKLTSASTNCIDQGFDLSGIVGDDYFGAVRTGDYDIGAADEASIGADIFVNQAADPGGDGSVGSPFRTISDGINAMSGGQTLEIAAGTYIEQMGNSIPNGTSWENATTIRAASGDVVKICGQNDAQTALNRAIQFTSASQKEYIIFDGFEFDGTIPSNGLYHAAKFDGNGLDGSAFDAGANPPHRYIRFANCVIHNCVASGIIDTNRGLNTHIELVSSTFYTNGGVSDKNHGAYMEGHYCYVRDCDFYDNSGNGLQIYDGTYPPDFADVQRCRSWNNGHRASKGHGFWFQGDDNTVINNLAWDNYNAGFALPYTNNSAVYHNTSFSNDASQGWYGISVGLLSGGSGNVVRNNIVYANVGGRDIFVNAAGTESNNRTTNPNFVDTVSDPPDLRLSASLNDGFDLTGIVDTDYVGTVRDATPDSGAYEYDGT
jgi:hypothetical protein